MKKFSFFFVLGLCIASLAEPVTLTLEGSVVMAIKGASNVLKAKQASDLSATTLLQSYLQFTPNLTARGDYTFYKGTSYLTQAMPATINSFNYGPDYTLTATLNLFNGLSDFASMKSALERRYAANFTLTRVKQQIALDIAQSFLQVVLDGQIIDIARSNLKTSEERQRLLEEQVKVGVSNEADLFRQRAQTSADMSYLISTENKRRTDLIVLLEKLRLDPNQQYELINPSLEQPIKSIKSAPERYGEMDKTIDAALHERTDLAASKRLLQSAKWSVTNAYSGFYPRLDFAANLYGNARYYDYLNVNGVPQALGPQPSLGAQLGKNISTTFGFSLNWNLWDNFVTPLNIQKAKVLRFDAKVDYEDNQRLVIGDVKQAYGDYEAAIQQLVAAKKGLDAANKAFELMQGRYEVGAASFLDLLTSQSAQTQAEATNAQSIISFALQERMMDFVLGTTKVD